MRTPGQVIVSLLLAACFALVVVFVSSYQGERQENRPEIIQMQFDLLEGKDYVINGQPMYLAAFQNRVLFPLLLTNLTRLGVLDANDAFLLLRLATTALALWVVYCAARGFGSVSVKLAAAAMLLVAYGLICTFGYNWEHPTDMLDVMFMAGMVWATATHRGILLLLIALAAAANRESAAFGGVLWAFCYGFNERWRPNWGELGRSFLLIALPYAVVLGLRYLFGGARAVVNETQLITAFTSFEKELNALIDYTSPFNWLALGAAMFVPPVVWVVSNWRTMYPIQRRLVYASAVLTFITFWFGILSELRIFLPIFVILVLTAVWSESARMERTAVTAAPLR